jgi:2-polyprenyl-6-hydroxyphenyl methylase/3-demethylubiquinone-9 3-methyltransferase|tara:strand:- start:1016 stop:1741 length:726 start_codon:yes stop_codon:yes gene_type:complete
MKKKSSKLKEFQHFSKISDQWWNSSGKFKILHELSPIRMKYLVKQLLPLNAKKTNSKKSLNNLDLLDLGCGGGLICEPLCRLGANVTGIDFIKDNIIIAKQHAKISNLNIEYAHQDLSNIKLDKKFNAILLLEVIEHLDDWKDILKKIKNFLKPNGIIIISTINRNIIAKIFAIFFAENVLRWVPKDTHSYEKLITPEEIEIFTKKNNMKIIDTTGLVYNPITSDWKLSSNLMINYFCTIK